MGFILVGVGSVLISRVFGQNQKPNQIIVRFVFVGLTSIWFDFGLVIFNLVRFGSVFFFIKPEISFFFNLKISLTLSFHNSLKKNTTRRSLINITRGNCRMNSIGLGGYDV